MPPLVPLAGSVFSAGGYVPAAPRDSPKTWASMVNEKQKAALSTRLGIPIIYGIDANHGNCYVYKATIFPHNIGLGATRDPMLVKKIGEATALEVRAAGIPYVFAPSLAIALTFIWAALQNLCRKKVAACARQYVGAGGTYNGIDQGNTVIDKNGMMSVHMRPYYSAILRGVSSFMVSYSSWNGVKTHANKFLITDYLKNSLKFRIMAPSKFTEFIDGLTSLVQNKVIPMSRIDDAVYRILRVKFTMGLFENPFADLSLAGELGKQVGLTMTTSRFCSLFDRNSDKLMMSFVVRSFLMYRNTGSWHAKPSGNPWCCLKNGKSAYTPLLPLRKKAGKILVAGRHADNLGYQCGGWTMSWQGQSGNNFTAVNYLLVNKKNVLRDVWNEIGTTILSAIKATVDRSTQVVYSENPDASHVAGGKYDYAIVVVGDKPYAEELGDNPSLTIPAPGPSVIQTVCKSVKCVVVIVSGRPLVVEPYLGAMDALVAAWLPGTEGQGVADVLFGDYGFSGKLPRTWFRSVDQLPMNLGDKHYDPLFPVGFGLTTQARK
ncbi:hypothetical protein PR202_ga13476 [Eleusine coracana subsp. coracana]|uniref:Uncharacterized protein n=1 Tax=Eleusine coracana subsp. coracana TaxID=191504 RepID=A0AAV5CEW1_ELECO|nr:hypothetical protein PR202_ga13476 [Eleusine coracana subsp. coracana]